MAHRRAPGQPPRRQPPHADGRLRPPDGAAALSFLVLRLRVDAVPEDRGGRRRAIPDGYRASLSFGQATKQRAEPIVHDGLLVWESAGVARVWVLEPRYLPRFDAGRVLTLLEGERIVARAEVLERLRDDAASPLADLRAAKTRRLAADEPASG